MSIGTQIKRYRLKAKISQRELGEKIGITQQQIAQYESGKRNPKFETILSIARALNCSYDDLDDRCLNINIGCSSGDEQLIKNGRLVTDITKLKEFVKECEDEGVPFQTLTEGEKLIVYFNSLNDEGKNKIFEYMELLLSSSKYCVETSEE